MKRYISVLLAVFVFVLGMAGTFSANAFPQYDQEKLRRDAAEAHSKMMKKITGDVEKLADGLEFNFSDTYDDDMKIDGIQNLRDNGEVKQGHLTESS